ncbi:MAG: aminomethyltransferase beta-barrel domain-containing protein, partial [Planctomycetota bacterium]|nr:aminomethyltransferase beta-barrel domain-containing protein [Planctomycetota bacterium]
RYNAEPVPAEIRVEGEGEDRRLHARFDERQAAVAPGQAIVCYDDDVVLGGGWIDSASNET